MNTIIAIVILGLVAYLIDRFIPMIEPVKTIFRIAIGIFAVILLLQLLGFSLGLPHISFR